LSLTNSIHQGDLINGSNSFVVLICDIDDIKERFPEKTDQEIKEIFDLAKDKMTDLTMESFWLSLDIIGDYI
jgi:hypothetical protein